MLHLPLIFLMKHVAATEFGLRQLSPSALHLAIYLGMLAALVGGAYLSYLIFESQTYRIGRLLKQWLARSTAIAPTTVATPAER